MYSLENMEEASSIVYSADKKLLQIFCNLGKDELYEMKLEPIFQTSPPLFQTIFVLKYCAGRLHDASANKIMATINLTFLTPTHSFLNRRTCEK